MPREVQNGSTVLSDMNAVVFPAIAYDFSTLGEALLLQALCVLYVSL